ncbi:MAG: carbohydrate kinase family protein [Candidatus Nomurabacteria bacterium]|nr:carbohydrate kinase family protein [Candidatus Nomurabacteria bacterium]
MNNIDFLAIGDIATEPFIKIKDAEANCDPDGNNCKLCLNYGGKIPYESATVCHAVGNSSNVAIGASRLGLNSCLISYIGNDYSGKKNIEQLNSEKVNTDYISTTDGLESNYHYVLWYGSEHTILVKHTEFPYSFPKDLPEPKWIYLSSLAENSVSYHREISQYLDSHPEVFLAFSPGTLQIKLGIEILKNIYKNTNVFLCNRSEAQTLLKINENDIPKLLIKMHELGPKIVVITDGINGSYSYDGTDILFMKAFPDENFVESTGAGDSFSGAFVVALFLEKDIPTALMWGAANAKSVVKHVGPHKGLLSRDEIAEYLKNAPKEYTPVKIN